MNRILVIQLLHPEALRLFRERPDVTFEVIADTSPVNLVTRIADADAVTIRDAPLPEQVLRAAPNLRVISRHGVGVDNIPIEYCTSRRLPVAVVGGVNTIAVAEHTMFLMLAAARSGIQLDHAVRTGDFAARSRITGVELRGRVLLLVGFGRIGQEVAARAAAFGMRILVFDPYVEPHKWPQVQFVATLAQGLSAASVLSLHLPLTAATRNLIGGRGGILDEAALLEALRSGHLRAAGLDTFNEEPLSPGHPLLTENNVILTPHAAALTEETLLAMGMVTVRNALDGLDGKLDPTLVVNPSVL
jgi:D-3-phosphoglycerate dehydrogenase / 2-oxoglutarate reductase